MSEIPIIIICYNNYKYVNNTLLQIKKINNAYYKNISILNNNSTCLDTINFLHNVDVKVINNNGNNGPWITNTNNKHIYDYLPDKFILTDPDLKLNDNIPTNFIQILSDLSDKYETYKIGFALDLTDSDKFYQNKNYTAGKSILNWETQFWTNKINNSDYDLYMQPIDTTFCLINKKFTNKQIRVAGNFLAKHLPWYVDNEIYSQYENYINSINTTNISTISKIIKSYIVENFLIIKKNKELFLIRNINDQNRSFWKDHYCKSWEDETFAIFDKILSNDKILIDIGGWVGPTAIYGIRKSKHVYVIEADTKSIADLNNNLKINSVKDNYTIISKAIFNVDNIKVNFGKNKFLKNSKLNDSTSHIHIDNINKYDAYFIKTITIKKLIKKYNINTSQISLIKVDIEGGEEHILDDLFTIYDTLYVSLYISFHHSWWVDKNLNRFKFLSTDIKNKILSNPFTSILFEKNR